MNETEFKKVYRDEINKFKGKGMDDEKLHELGEQAMAKLDISQPHVQKIGPRKLASMTVALHAPNLAKKTSGNVRGGFKKGGTRK